VLPAPLATAVHRRRRVPAVLLAVPLLLATGCATHSEEQETEREREPPAGPP